MLLEVVINEETRSTKYVRKDDPLFERITWEKYVLDCFAVGFDFNNNPVSSKIGGSIIHVESKATTFRPKEIRGDFLRIQWFVDNDETKESNTGWIRWKEKDFLIIHLFEIA